MRIRSEEFRELSDDSINQSNHTDQKQTYSAILAYVLAKYGLLDGYRCTIQWENIPSFREEFPNIDITMAIYAIDRTRWTCAGGTAALDMMLRFIAEQGGVALARKVAEVSLHPEIRAGKNAQRHDLRYRLGTANDKLIEAVQVMESHIEDPLSCRQLAETVHLSTQSSFTNCNGSVKVLMPLC